MFEVDKYLGRQFHITRGNCWHFVRDVWKDLTGEQLWDYTPAVTTKSELELAAKDAAPRFIEVPEFNVPCFQHLIVLFQRPRDTPHVGVLYKQKVLHLRAEGAMYQPLEVAKVGFPTVRFFITSQTP